MNLYRLSKNALRSITASIANILVPQNVRIKKILDLPPEYLRRLLPKSPVYSKNIFVLFDYQNKIVRLLVKAIKYKNNIEVRSLMAALLYEELTGIAEEIHLFAGSAPLLLPMPMSKLEKRSRSFNQCEELAKNIKRLAGQNIEVSLEALSKVRETERQARLSRELREINVQNSMAADDFVVRGRVCIVLDDVYTTGASLSEARRALLGAGAKDVFGLFIAH